MRSTVRGNGRSTAKARRKSLQAASMTQRLGHTPPRTSVSPRKARSSSRSNLPGQPAERQSYDRLEPHIWRGGRIQAIFLLGSDAKLAYQQRAAVLHIQLPAKPVGEIAYVFRITLDNAAQRNAKAK